MNKKFAIAAKYWQIRILLCIIPLLMLANCNASTNTPNTNAPNAALSERGAASPSDSSSSPETPAAPAASPGPPVLRQDEPPLNLRPAGPGGQKDANTEAYNRIDDNPFERVSISPLSTFAIDVDTASYTNVRRFINEGELPPKDAVRIEELINYFTYDYPQPTGDRPFSIATEISAAPWNPKHKLVQIGLQGKHLATENLPPSNLVFLLDVSGSMDEPNKLPLLKQSLRLLANQLTEKDLVSIVVYAGAAGVVLPPTNGNRKDKILDAIEQLQAGGSTAGGEGMKLAYELASR